jgi:hypothetical protein
LPAGGYTRDSPGLAAAHRRRASGEWPPIAGQRRQPGADRPPAVRVLT